MKTDIYFWSYFAHFFLEWRLFQAKLYKGADKSLARPSSRCILFDGENISFDASLVTYMCVCVCVYIYIYIYIYI